MFIAEIGTYAPLKQPSEIKIDLERAEYWIKNGAQPTDTVRALLKKAAPAPVQEEEEIVAAAEEEEEEEVPSDE